MNLSDTFYIALCMTVLILGVVYWFWTQNQYIQRKINLLENMVYEMKTTLNSLAPEGGRIPSHMLDHSLYPPAPSSELGDDEDLLHEELHAETMLETGMPMDDEIAEHGLAAPIERAASADRIVERIAPVERVAPVETLAAADDLQPGGVGSGIDAEIVAQDMTAVGTSLDSMTIKELKRLAEQRGIHGGSTMRKQALIDSLRNNIPGKSLNVPFEVSEGTLQLS